MKAWIVVIPFIARYLVAAQDRAEALAIVADSVFFGYSDEAMASATVESAPACAIRIGVE